METPFVQLRKIFLVTFLMLVAGWVGVGLFAPHHDWYERGFIISAHNVMPYPVPLPRYLGLIWFVIPAALILWAEHRSEPRGEDPLGFALLALSFVIVVFGLVTLVSIWASPWLSLGVAALLGLGFAELMSRDNFPAGMMASFLTTACAVGIWTGFYSGLIHAFTATVAYTVWSLICLNERDEAHYEIGA